MDVASGGACGHVAEALGDEGQGLLVCDAATLVISSDDHGLDKADPFYAGCFSQEDSRGKL